MGVRFNWARCSTVLLLILWAAPLAHAADPVTLLLLRMLRDQAVSSGVETAVDRAQAAPKAALPPVPEGYGISGEQLRTLIDTGFVHLAPAQRAEIYRSVIQMLADPKNAAARPLIIEELALKASAVRAAHERLAALSPAEKQAVAADLRSEYERLPADERAQLLRVLQAGVVPIPRDLGELILAEMARSGGREGAPPVPVAQ